jgi:hypothetical protein
MRWLIGTMICAGLALLSGAAEPKRSTVVSIVGDQFHINGQPTYKGGTI